MSAAEPRAVGDYKLVPYEGLWFLTDDAGETVSTILDMGGGTWRARTPEGSARTFQVPPGTEDPALWVAKKIAS